MARLSVFLFFFNSFFLSFFFLFLPSFQPPSAASAVQISPPFLPFEKDKTIANFWIFLFFWHLAKNPKKSQKMTPPPSLHLFFFLFWLFAKSLPSPKGDPSAATWRKVKKGKRKDEEYFKGHKIMARLCYACALLCCPALVLYINRGNPISYFFVDFLEKRFTIWPRAPKLYKIPARHVPPRFGAQVLAAPSKIEEKTKKAKFLKIFEES